MGSDRERVAGLAGRAKELWEYRPEASRRVARALGFRELGAQASIRLGRLAD